MTLTKQEQEAIEVEAAEYKNIAMRQLFINLTTAYALKAKVLVEALRKIDAISFHKNEWKEMAEIQIIVKQALSSYNQPSGK